MANFSSLTFLLNTTEGMTVLRNNVSQDDGVDTIVGVDWFKFNNITASNIYASGNSFIGFGANAEHLKVWRRDTKMFYLYRQEGTIGDTKFLKIRWEGYAHYNVAIEPVALRYEVFLFSDGRIFLNFFKVPNSSYTGINNLTCGSNTYAFSVSPTISAAFVFTPQNETRTTWAVSEQTPTIVSAYKLSGQAVVHIADINSTNIIASTLTWSENVPEGTSIIVSVSTDSHVFSEVQNGGQVVTNGSEISDLFVKVEMSTIDPTKTPLLSDMKIVVRDSDDAWAIILHIEDLRRFNSAAGNITVAYDAAIGNLAGIGGPEESFDLSFAPTDLIAKPHQNDQEHLEISDISADGTLTKVYYINTSETEHISISNITAVGTLTHIDDI